MPTIAQLSQRHPSYDGERLADIKALYEGDALMEKRLKRFLPQREREPAQRYALRKKEAYYRNYLGPIVDYFAAMLFTSPPQPVAQRPGENEAVPDPGDYYNALRGNCDKRGSDIDALFKDRLIAAMLDGHSWIRLHQPSATGAPPANLADFQARKLGDAWLTAVETEQVYDWETDEDGNLEWAIIHSQKERRTGPAGKRDTVTRTWEFLTADEVQTFEITYPKDNPPTDETEVSLVETELHKFGKVPLLCIELPAGLWVGSRLRSPQLAHFRAINAQAWSLASTCYAMPVAKVADPDAFKEAAQGAGYGIVIGQDDSWEWEAPPTAHFAAQDTEIKSHKDEIFRIANQMALGVDNNAAAVGRSADSKVADAQSTRVVLVAFAKVVKEKIALTYNVISASRGDKYEWTVGGLDEFASADLQGFLQALELSDKSGGIPSKTANVEIMTRKVEGLLPDLSQELRAKIRQELETGVLDPVEEREKEEQFRREEMALNANRGAPPGKPGAGAKPKIGKQIGKKPAKKTPKE